MLTMKVTKSPYNIINHWLSSVTRCESPNADDRPANAPIDLLVIHNISLPPDDFGGGYIEQLFCNALDCSEHPYFEKLIDLKVSSHLLIDRAGQITQFVPFNRRAWHAGQSSYCGKTACNDFSIGIELEGTDTEPYTEDQYRQLCAVTHTLIAHYPALSTEHIVGHSDIAPGRKTDPGPAFDWHRYKQGLLS